MPSKFNLLRLIIVLFSVELSSVSCETFYIVTSPTGPCPGQFTGVLCLTLQQYVSNPSQGQNITLLVEPGMYNLSTVLTVSSDYFTISSTNATVACTSATARFEFNNVENVHIFGITFQGCRNAAIRMIRVASASIVNSNFINNEAFSGSTRHGGALFATFSSISVSECEFHNNIAYYSGGAISAQSSNILVDSSVFENNTARTGGAVYCSSGNSQIVNTTFLSNRIRGGGDHGGAISIQSSTSSLITRCQFMDNSALLFGGAIFTSSSSIPIVQCQFWNNIASSGGAIHKRDSNVSIIESYFFNNFASTNGGALYSENNRGAVLIAQCQFMNNSARGPGGALYVNAYVSDRNINEATIMISQCQIINNTATNNRADTSDGGGIYLRVYVERNIAISTNIIECNISKNVASGNGGAIYVQRGQSTRSTTKSYILITDCQFIFNTAGESGGAVYKTGSNDSLIVDNSYCSSNLANAFGGTLYISGTNSSVSVTNSAFINNMAIREGGGAIYSNGLHANVTLNSSIFCNNSASYCSVLDVDNYNHFSVNLTNSVFTYNTASGQTIGGGVACIRNASINILDSTFKHNFASHHAGVFYIDESQTSVDGSVFINNSAAVDGGVFYTGIHVSDYVIMRSRFIENTAGNDGGVMLIGRPYCYVSIDETIFESNSARDRGGVASVLSSSVVLGISGIYIFNNVAQFGGVISACNSHVTLLDDSLSPTVDPMLPSCMLYEGDINITVPQNPGNVTNTEPPTITEPLRTMTDQTAIIEPLTTTIDHANTTEILTATMDKKITTALGMDIDQFTTNSDQKITGLVPGEKDNGSVVILGSQLAIILLTTFLGLFVIITVSMFVVIAFICVCKSGNNNQVDSSYT